MAEVKPKVHVPVLTEAIVRVRHRRYRYTVQQ